ncbi:MAG: SOS response-associated peptidase [Candidatus Baltobacteraceae bacterium]
MCGRFSFFARRADIAAAFPFLLLDADFDSSFPARYNIAPTQRTPIVRSDLHLTGARWGFGLPHTFNARAESAADRPLYRRSYFERPALVPANGWFEWEPTPSGKRPFFIAAPDRRPILFAALWDIRDASPCFSIFTRSSRFELHSIHHREPVVIDGDDALRWLDVRLSPEARASLLAPRTEQSMHFACREIARAVNDIGNDGPDIFAAPTSSEAARDIALFPPATMP